jgi:hypothetical protein
VLVRTACGTDAVREFYGMRGPRLRLPLVTRAGIAWYSEDQASADSVALAREFDRCSRDELGPDAGRMAVYTESRIVAAKPPEAPRFTNAEWGDAIRRFMHFQDAEFGREWHEATVEFMRRHDGAKLVHFDGPPRSTLMGAWYPAPQWQQAHEAVSMFTVLRNLMDGRP